MKHGRNAQDVAELATQLHALQADGASISTWLDRHHDRLQSLVPLGWTWDQLSEAMNAAGIRYKAGKLLPMGGVSRGCWTGEQLRNAVRRARAQDIKRRMATQEVLARVPLRTLPAVTPPTPNEVVQRPVDEPRPVVRVLSAAGAERLQAGSGTGVETGSVQRVVDEKNARAQSVVDGFLNRRKDDGCQT